MTAHADIANRRTDSFTLSELRNVIAVAMARAAEAAEVAQKAAAGLEMIEPALSARIEANRRRSMRHRQGWSAPDTIDSNGHSADVALKLTNHGLIQVCRCCGQQVTG